MEGLICSQSLIMGSWDMDERENKIKKKLVVISAKDKTQEYEFIKKTPNFFFIYFLSRPYPNYP